YQAGPPVHLEGTLSERLRGAGHATLALGRLPEDGAALGFEHAVHTAERAELAQLVPGLAPDRPPFPWRAPQTKQGASQRAAADLAAALGDLVAVLSDRGRLERTLFAFVADTQAHPVFQATLCQEKNLRRPMFLAWPGRIPAGVRGETITLLDLAPTLL